jgi:hypothetical protein
MKPSSKSFKPGETYFIVTFSDEALAVPVVQTLIFEKSGAHDNGATYHLFRQVPVEGPEEIFLVEEEHVAHLVLSKEDLLRKLEDCFLRRP